MKVVNIFTKAIPYKSSSEALKVPMMSQYLLSVNANNFWPCSLGFA